MTSAAAIELHICRLLIELKKRAVPCVSLNSSVGSQDLDWGSDAFKARVHTSCTLTL